MLNLLVKNTLFLANGTDAIELILRALEIGYGDEVILPTNSFIATSIAVSRTGAKPIFVDNDEFYLIDLNDVNKKITKKPKQSLQLIFMAKWLILKNFVQFLIQKIFI